MYLNFTKNLSRQEIFEREDLSKICPAVVKEEQGLGNERNYKVDYSNINEEGYKLFIKLGTKIFYDSKYFDYKEILKNFANRTSLNKTIAIVSAVLTVILFQTIPGLVVISILAAVGFGIRTYEFNKEEKKIYKAYSELSLFYRNLAIIIDKYDFISFSDLWENYKLKNNSLRNFVSDLCGQLRIEPYSKKES